MAIFGSPLGSGLGAEMQAYLDKKLITNLTQMTRYDRYASAKRNLPLKNSKVIEMRKWIPAKQLWWANNINETIAGNDATIGEETLLMVGRDAYQDFILDEGSSGSSKASMKRIIMSAEVFAIGDWMPYTEELELFDDMWSTTEAINQMSEMAALVVDGYYRDLYYYGAGHVYDITGDGSGNDNVVDPAFTANTKKLVTALTLSGSKPVKAVLSSSPDYGTIPVNSRFIAVGHISAIDALESNPDWKPIETYADGVQVLEGERGMLGQIRFIEDANGFIESNGTNYNAEFLVFGDDHTEQIPLRGKGKIETVVQGLGSGGSSDPLKRVATIGWKSWLCAKVTRPERLGVLKARFNL